MKVDVLIVGTGLAGLFTALNIGEDLNVLLITKGRAIDCNSYLAQGGISTALSDEDINLLIKDTLKAGNYKNNVNSVKEIAIKSRDRIKELIEFGVEFDKDDREINYTKEGGHTVNRIVHVKDQTGKHVIETLLRKIKSRNNIKLLENNSLVNLIISNNKCIGAIIKNEAEEFNVFSKVTVLATGGLGGIFNSTTNVETLTGDGIKIALSNKVKVIDMEYQQLHPTVLYKENSTTRRLLISESLRGEGAFIVNEKGEKFINPLLPRDVVSNSILNEISKSNKPYVYLDARHLGKEYLKNRFPYIYNECLKEGFKIEKDLIPIAPAHHFSMGGIKIDLFGRTSLENLYAVGEVSCSGVHGSNRLASNSLLEAMVFSKNTADNINSKVYEIEDICEYKPDLNKVDNDILIDYLKERVDVKYDKLFNC